ncbi:MAG: hypothetical protein IJE40_00855 [Clostridia bacterium]|nr:hypothetical protein [Clostridia bacterium]
MKKMLLLMFSIVLLSIMGCSEKEVLPVEVSLKGENSVNIVVLVDEPNYAISEMASAFAEKISELTGKNVEVAEKSQYSGSEYAVYVDVLKDSNNPSFNAHLDPLSTDVFTYAETAVNAYENNYEIIYNEFDAQIIAPDEYSLYFAMSDFLEDFRLDTFSVYAGTRTLVPLEGNVLTPAELISEVGDVRFLFAEHKLTFVYNKYEALTPGNIYLIDVTRDGMQGCCFDGKYCYFALMAYEETFIYKVDFETLECVGVSEILYVDHANDMTYDPNRNCLIVAHGYAGNDGGEVSYIDADTLEYLGTGEMVNDRILTYGVSGLDYNADAEQYVIASFFTYYIYDKDMNYISSFDGKLRFDAYQGLCSDGIYIYDSRYGQSNKPSESGQNRIIIHDIQGNFISEGHINGDPVKKSENENVFIHNNLFYVGYYNNPRTLNEYIMVPVEMFE